jgi:O-antigen chain-terminating methyltransferase
VEAGAREGLTKQMEERFQEQQVSDVEESVTSLYPEFEDLFRGPREEIKERLKVHLPRIQQSNAGSLEAPVLDLGCGRGEWLQLLSEYDFVGRGVDTNPVMVGRCCDLGLQAIEADALAYLKSLPDRCLGAITSFHMIEHVPFEALMAIVDEAMRVLQSGGLLILETPNPQNVLVGSQTFWIDPTHVHPVLSQTLRFFLEARGFCQLEVINLQPYPETARVPEDSALAQRFNEYFYGPQDYCIIGRRP